MSLFNDLFQAVHPLLPPAFKRWGAREFFNQRFGHIATMTTLQIDSAKRTATLDLDLKGESQPLRITIPRYELTAIDGKIMVEIKEVQTSREWVSLLLAEFTKNGKLKFPVPEAAKALL